MISAVLIRFATGSRIAQKAHSLVEAVDALQYKAFRTFQMPQNSLQTVVNQTPSIQGVEILTLYGFQ